jgi:hypothetical protein
MAAAERIEFMGVIRQQRSRLLDYLLPGHVASRSFGSRKLWEFTAGAASEALAEANSSRQSPVCTEKLNPGIVVMESAENGRRIDTPGRLNRARDWRIFVQ